MFAPNVSKRIEQLLGPQRSWMHSPDTHFPIPAAQGRITIIDGTAEANCHY